MAGHGKLTVASSIRGKLPRLPLDRIHEHILGKKYELSIAFIGEDRAREINRRSRGKTYAPNVLSFPLGTSEGEIYICPVVARRQAPRHDMSYRTFLIFLAIHGMLHLKGMDHSDTMESMERALLKRFS
jgi:probable rRNA maturation factor